MLEEKSRLSFILVEIKKSSKCSLNKQANKRTKLHLRELPLGIVSSLSLVIQKCINLFLGVAGERRLDKRYKITEKRSWLVVTDVTTNQLF